MKRLLVLLSTYNGEKYLREQIDSVLSQINVDVDILVRDDGSSDKTVDILKEYEKKGALNWYQGDNLKPAKSFLDLVNNSGDYDFYAFCDQDDYWMNDKLIIAVERLSCFNNEEPCLYYGKPRLADKDLNPFPQSCKYRIVNSMASSFITSNATGCTFVFNKKLRDIIMLNAPYFLVMHDDWVAKICWAVGGKVYFDTDVHILYRQHGNNVIGGKQNFRKRWSSRIKRIFKKEKTRSKTGIEILDLYRDYLSLDSKRDLEAIYNYFYKNKRFSLAFNKRFRTNSFKVNMYFIISVLMGAF